jgi:hypothetical protein
MMRQMDSIDSAGYPLAFLVGRSTHADDTFLANVGEVSLRVEVRSLPGHQKEILMSEGERRRALLYDATEPLSVRTSLRRQDETYSRAPRKSCHTRVPGFFKAGSAGKRLVSTTISGIEHERNIVSGFKFNVSPL